MPYRGMMLNGNEAPIAYSVYGLERFFGEDADRAVRLMMRRSRPGGACGLFFREAQTGERPDGVPVQEGNSGRSGTDEGPDR